MFKKRWPWPRRNATRRYAGRTAAKLPARVIPKSIARVRTDWVSVYNPWDAGGCAYLVAPWAPATERCVSSFALNIMSVDQLSQDYGDDVKIVAMRGALWLRPVFDNVNLCSYQELRDWENAVGNYFIMARGGLKRQEITEREQASLGLPVWHPLDSLDWTDGKFLQMWERVWVAPPTSGTQRTYNDGQVVGICPNVHQSGYNVPVTASGDQDPYSVPALSTTCGVFNAPAESCLDGGFDSHFSAPGWKRVSLNRRKDIRMHENHDLQWYVDWGNVWPGQNTCNYDVTGPAPCAMHILPMLKIKLQYG